MSEENKEKYNDLFEIKEEEENKNHERNMNFIAERDELKCLHHNRNDPIQPPLLEELIMTPNSHDSLIINEKKQTKNELKALPTSQPEIKHYSHKQNAVNYFLAFLDF